MNFSDYVTTDFVGAGFVLVTPNNKILILQKPNKKWSFPGGKSEIGETPIVTAKRETLEEIGVFPRGQPYKMIKYKRPEDGGICFSFLMNVDQPFPPTLSHEHIEYMWTTSEEIDKLNLSKAIRGSWSLIKASLV